MANDKLKPVDQIANSPFFHCPDYVAQPILLARQRCGKQIDVTNIPQVFIDIQLQSTYTPFP